MWKDIKRTLSKFEPKNEYDRKVYKQLERLINDAEALLQHNRELRAILIHSGRHDCTRVGLGAHGEEYVWWALTDNQKAYWTNLVGTEEEDPYLLATLPSHLQEQETE